MGEGGKEIDEVTLAVSEGDRMTVTDDVGTESRDTDGEVEPCLEVEREPLRVTDPARD